MFTSRTYCGKSVYCLHALFSHTASEAAAVERHWAPASDHAWASGGGKLEHDNKRPKLELEQARWKAMLDPGLW